MNCSCDVTQYCAIIDENLVFLSLRIIRFEKLSFAHLLVHTVSILLHILHAIVHESSVQNKMFIGSNLVGPRLDGNLEVSMQFQSCSAA